MFNRKVLFLFLCVLGILLPWSAWKFLDTGTKSTIRVSPKEPVILSKDELFLQPGGSAQISITLRQVPSTETKLYIALENRTNIETNEVLTFKKQSKNADITLRVKAHRLGESTIQFHSTNKQLKDLQKVKVKVHVVRNLYLSTFSFIVGWGYFLVWSVSYYPQIYENWRRHSVVGYSFDFLSISGSGQLFYAVYNAALCWSITAKREFLELHPGSDLPVKTNDNYYTLHGMVCVAILILECVIYERGTQRISSPVKLLLGSVYVAVLLSLVAVLRGSLKYLIWLNFLTFLKVVATPLQYSPQVWLNYCNKSTKGWSIYGVLLDFSGGFCSFLQVVIDLINTGDLEGLLGNPTKLLLGLIAMCYNVIFFLQHFVFYKETTELVR